MSDWVADREASYTSLNRQSWSGEGRERRSTDTTPLLSSSRQKAPAISDRGDGGTLGTGGEGSASFSALDQRRKGLFSTRAAIGENCHRLTGLEWIFVAVATLTIAGIAAMSVERFVFIHRSFSNFTPDFNESMGNGQGFDFSSGEGSGDDDHIQCSHWSCLNDFTFAVLVSANWMFCVYYCYNGLLRERPFEILAYGFTIFIVLTDVVVNFFVEGEQGDIVKLVRLVLAFILGPVNIVLVIVVQRYMGFMVLSVVGSNEELTRAYHSRSLFLTIQTLNVQILVNILVLSWVKAGHFTGLGEKITFPVLIVYVIIIAYLGWAAVMWEVRPLAVAWIPLASFSFGYYLFKIVNIGVHWSYYREMYTENYANGQPSTRTNFLSIAISILFCCVLGVVVGVVLAGLMVSMLGNFGKGLRERAPPPCCTGKSKDDLM